MRRRRRLLVVTLVLLALTGIILLVARIYLRSDRVTAQVAARLQSALGVPVRLERAAIGASGSSLYGLRLLEVGAAPADPPWLTVRQIDADLTALDLFEGDSTPRELTLLGASLLLRYDRANRLLTRLPHPRQGAGAFPRLHFRDSRLILRQDGRADLIISGIDAELQPDGSRLVLTGSVADPEWGSWNADGSIDVAAGTIALNLQTAAAAVTEARLRALPFVPPRVWAQVQAEGDTPVEFMLRLNWSAGGAHYRVAVAPASARVRIAAIGLEAEHVQGRVIVEDGLVELRELRGRTADGEIEVDGDLDFRTAPSRLSLTIAGRQLDVRRLPGSWGLPELLEGRLTGRARLQITLLPDRTQTIGEGRGAIADVKIAGVPAPPIELRLDSGALDALVALQDADLEQLTRGLGAQPALAIAGRLSLQAQAVLPLDTIRDARTYRLRGTAELSRLVIAGWELKDVGAVLRLEQGNLTVTGLQGSVEDVPVVGGGELQLVEPYRFQLRLDARHGDLAAAHRRLPELRPALDIEGSFALTADLRGTLKPFTIAASGTGRVNPLRLEELRIEQVQFRWNSDGRRLNLTDLSAQLYDGRLDGSLIVSLTNREPGNANIRFHELDLSLMGRDVPGLPFDVAGRAGGTLQGTLSAGGPGRPQEFAAQIDVHAERLRVQQLPAEDFHSSIRYRKSAVDYRCEGNMLGGRFLLEGRLPSRGTETATTAPEGRLRLQGLQLARAWPELGVRESLARLRGTLDMELGFRHHGSRGLPAGRGRFVLGQLRWDDNEVAGSLRGDILLERQQLRLRDVTATIGEGLLNGQVRLDLDRPERSSFTLSVQNVEASRLLPWAGWAAQVQGPLDLSLRGTLGREWSGAGRLSLVRGRVLGVEVADLQAPVDFSFAPRFGNGQVNLREAGGQVAMGRATARASLGWGTSPRLDGQLRFYGVDLRTLFRQVAELNQVGGGRMSGRIDFAGSDLGSLDDLTAGIEASFTQTQALELPVLRSLLPYLLPGQSASPLFQNGELRAHLARGVLRVQRLALTGTLLQVLLEGTVTLQGRLDLSVTANAGRSDLSPPGFRLAAGPVPFGILRQASGFLANRLVRLHLAGTVRSPAIQVEPLPVLTEEALRFFLGRSP